MESDYKKNIQKLAMPISMYGIDVRMVEEEDAEFILKLRRDPKLKRFIHDTSDDIEQQKQWIRNYKEREKRGEEFYFLYSCDGKALGVNRISDINLETFTLGSWLFSSEALPQSSVLADIILKKRMAEALPTRKAVFDVRKKNKAVVSYHKRYNPDILGEDDLNYYFSLNHENALRGAKKNSKLLRFLTIFENMEIKEFIGNFSDQLEDTDVSILTAETKFKELEEWSSLVALSIIAMVDDEYDVRVSGEDIKNVNTISELFKLVESRVK